MSEVKLGVSYFGVRNPEHVKVDLARMVDAGCNAVLHTFSENDLLFYPSTMEEIVTLSKEQGLEVYLDPWGVGGVFGGEAFTNFALEHDEARQVTSAGTKAPAACPNSQEFREFMLMWVRSAVKSGADVIFLDEPHFWSPHITGGDSSLWACRCKNCQVGFQKKFGKPLPDTLTPEVREFQIESLRSFLEELAQEAKSGGARVALCLLPDWEKPKRVLEYWDKFASIKDIDIFGTDPYWLWAGKPFSDYEFFVQTTVNLASRYGKEPQIWVQACNIKAGEEHWVGRAVKRAWELGVKNIMAWSFLGTPYMTWVKSDKPHLVWNELSSAYLSIRGADNHVG